jgi:hypothetical protein
MPNYDYSSNYKEKDPQIKFRKCKFCNKIVKISELENKFTCKKCYSLINLKKRCKICNLRKFVTEFFKHNKYQDGREPICKQCLKSNL